MWISPIVLVLSSIGAEAFVVPKGSSSRFALLSLNAKKKVFIDGEAGTTGLQVRGRLEAREDLELISPPSDLRKDEATRKKFINEADAVILCTYTHCHFAFFLVLPSYLGTCVSVIYIFFQLLTFKLSVMNMCCLLVKVSRMQHPSKRPLWWNLTMTKRY